MHNRVPVGYRFYWDSESRPATVLKGLYQGLDWFNRITFVPLWSEPGDIDLGHLSFQERASSSHLVTPEGQVFSRGAAMIRLLNLLPLFAPFMLIFRVIPGHSVVADALYGLLSADKSARYERGEIPFVNLEGDD